MILIDTRTSTLLAKRPTCLAQLAHGADKVRVAQRLRFEVFNLELNEGLAESHFTGLDADRRPRNRKDIALALREQIVAVRS
jgi:putative hemolysin